jgi:hypothetical protein
MAVPNDNKYLPSIITIERGNKSWQFSPHVIRSVTFRGSPKRQKSSWQWQWQT